MRYAAESVKGVFAFEITDRGRTYAFSRKLNAKGYPNLLRIERTVPWYWRTVTQDGEPFTQVFLRREVLWQRGQRRVKGARKIARQRIRQRQARQKKLAPTAAVA